MAVVRKLAKVFLSERKVTDNCRYILLPVFDFSRNYTSSSISSFKFSDLKIETVTEARRRKMPDPSKLLFGECFSDHMFEVEWRTRSGWAIPRIVPFHAFQCHPGSKIFHYAQAAFEGMKAFKCSDGSVSLFRPDLNIKRLLATAKRADLPLFDGDEFLMCLKKLVSIEKDWIPDLMSSSLYIRPTFIGTQNSLGVQSSNSALLYIICCPVGPYFIGEQTKPISLLADPTYVRAWPGGVGDKKMASNYAPTMYVQRLAQEQGLQQVLWLIGDDHKVAEAGAMNVFFFFRRGGNELELATPPLDGTILPGVTRQSIIELAKNLNEFHVTERCITMNEIMTENAKGALLEMFVCGTAVSVCPVSRIRYLEKDINIPTMERENPLYQRLHKALTDIQYGKVESEWSVKIN